MVNEITDDLKSINNFHLQCDGWSNQRNEDERSQRIELEEEHEVDSMESIHDVGQSLNIDVGVDLANYGAKQGLWSRPFIWKHVAEMDPVVWWRRLQVQIAE
ncbi:hypothetical protein evm_011661 [Chilo suppressalis]|nr:hypothetical protein evm_011661 [Chilo suppressalis]